MSLTSSWLSGSSASVASAAARAMSWWPCFPAQRQSPLLECCGVGKQGGGSLVELEAVAVVGPADQEVTGMVQDVGEVRRSLSPFVVGQVEQREQSPAALLQIVEL